MSGSGVMTGDCLRDETPKHSEMAEADREAFDLRQDWRYGEPIEVYRG